MSLIEDLGREEQKQNVPVVHVGDEAQVHYLIKEGEKERIQIFQGTIISISGRGVARTITVRKTVQGEGVERIFPIHSPRVKDVVVSKHGRVRRSKLYYLRDRVGKGTRVQELVGAKARRSRALAQAVRKAAAEEKTEATAPEETVEV